MILQVLAASEIAGKEIWDGFEIEHQDQNCTRHNWAQQEQLLDKGYERKIKDTRPQ